MKIHRHLVQAVSEILENIFVDNYYADKVLEYHFKRNKKWGARDRRFVAESVYDIVRWSRRLWYAVDQEPFYNEKTAWLLIGAWMIAKKYDLPDWTEFQSLHRKQILDRYTKPSSLAIECSVPDWIFERGHGELGAKWQAAVMAMNNPAEVVLRTNRLKIGPEKLKLLLAAEEIHVRQDKNYPDALILNERANVFKTKSFHDGYFEVQDAMSQTIAPFLGPLPGERVIDACAGAGGKSLHLAALMKNKGKILSMDIDEGKLAELRKRASRGGVDIIECKVIESSKTIKRLVDSADRLLLDVPCSGTGVWRRNPDSRWKLNPESLEAVILTQQKILADYSSMVKVGGTLVYSTCSILKSENEKQVEGFLSTHPRWELLEQTTRLPQDSGFDGFYMAKLKRFTKESGETRSP